MSNPSASDTRIHVWDLPTRLFHWALAVLFVVSIVSVKMGNMELHEKSGIALLTLIAFRIVWGFVGGRFARFASFLAGPKAVAAYLLRLRPGDGMRHLGHNPLGGWSVIAMLASVGTQAVTGLFADDGIMTQGPLAMRASSATTTLMTRIHHLNEYVMYSLVALHILAVMYYLIARKDNLVRPMLTGYKAGDPSAPGPGGTRGSPALAAIILAALAALVWYFIVRK